MLSLYLMDGVKGAKLSIGFIIIIIYLIISILSTISGIFSKSFLLFGYAILGLWAIIYNLITIFINILIIYSVIKRVYWGWILAIAYFAFLTFEGIVSLLLLIFNRQTIIDNLILYLGTFGEKIESDIVALISGWVIFLLGIIISAIILIYFYRKKDFFNE